MLTFSLPKSRLRDRWCVPSYISSLSGANRKHKTRALGEIAKIRSGIYISKYQDAGVPYIRVDNIREFQFNENRDDLVYVNPRIAKVSERCFVETNDVVVARTGTLGKASFVQQSQTGWLLSQHSTRLTFEREELAGVVATYLNSQPGKMQLVSSGFGSTRPELTHEALGEIQVAWIDEATQCKIHRVAADGARLNGVANQALRECVTELDHLIGITIEQTNGQAVFEVPSLVDSPLWTPQYFQPRLVEPILKLARDFECLPLGDIASVTRGKGTRAQDYVRDGIPFVRTTSLINFGIDPFPDHYATEETYKLYKQPVREGDILYSIEGKIGMSGYILADQPCVFKNHIERIRVSNTHDPLYVFLFLNTLLGKVQAQRYTVVQATLPGMASRLRELLIPLATRGKMKADFKRTVEQLTTKAAEAFKQKRLAVEKWNIARSHLAKALS